MFTPAHFNVIKHIFANKFVKEKALNLQVPVYYN